MIAAAGRAPLKRRTSLPARKRIIVGMLRMPNREAISGTASVSTFATTIFPARSPAILIISGATARHGPHHSAQKSTSTGTGTSRINSSNSSGLATTTGWVSGRSGFLQAPHFAFSPKRAAGKRFELEQDGHETIIAVVSCGRRRPRQGRAPPPAEPTTPDTPPSPQGSPAAAEDFFSLGNAITKRSCLLLLTRGRTSSRYETRSPSEGVFFFSREEGFPVVMKLVSMAMRPRPPKQESRRTWPQTRPSPHVNGAWSTSQLEAALRRVRGRCAR